MIQFALLFLFLVSLGLRPANAASASEVPSKPAVAQDTTAKKAEGAKLEKIFGLCTEDRFSTLAAVDAFKGFSAEEKALCKERLTLLNPVIE